MDREATHRQADGRHRDAGIDLFKALAVVFVVVHHVVDCGVSMPETPGFALRELRYGLHGLVYACVDMFALATGYLCVTSRKTAGRVLRPWLQTVAIGLAGTALCRAAGAETEASDWLRAAFPVVTGEYWYVTAYFALCCLMPLLNAGARATDAAVFRKSLATLALAAGVSSVLFPGDPFVLKHGYGFAWMLVMYLAGAYWRLHVAAPPRPVPCAAVAIAASHAYLLPSLGKRLLPGAAGAWSGGLDVTPYTSPATVAVALAVFGLCRNVRDPGPFARKALSSLSGASLGIYLWLVHPVFWRAFWRPGLSRVVVATPWQFVWKTALAAVCALAAAWTLESLRAHLFRLAEGALPYHGSEADAAKAAAHSVAVATAKTDCCRQ